MTSHLDKVSILQQRVAKLTKHYQALSEYRALIDQMGENAITVAGFNRFGCEVLHVSL